MKVNSIVSVYDFSSGHITVTGDGVDMQVKLDVEQLARLADLSLEFFLEHQKQIAAKISEIPPSNRLEAPKAEPEYTPYEPVSPGNADLADDVPF